VGKKLDEHDIVQKLKELASEMGKTPTLLEFSKVISKRQINKHGYINLCNKAGIEHNKHTQSTDPVEVIIRPPKILVFDIECTGMILESYGLYNQNHSHKDIIEDWSLLSFAAWFTDEEDITYADNRENPDYRDDKQLVTKLHDLISQADWIVGHNSDKFDLKKFNTKAEKYELPPRPDPVQYDTLKMLKARYALPSNSLDYAAKYFDLKERKSGHGKFPGKMLFDECKKGNPEAWIELEAYNKQDVRVTWELFQRLAKHDKRINLTSFYQKQTCICGNQSFFKNGIKYSRNAAHQIWRCHQCSKCFLGKENLIDKDIRSGFLK
jgi:DNA polymerase elongation subunit (family B)